MPIPPRPVEIQGVQYPSVYAASRALGVSRTQIVRAIKQGKTDRIGMGNEAHQMPTLIRGVLYPSRTAAAEALGVDVTTVVKAIARGRADAVAAPRKVNCPTPPHAKPMTIAGISFTSKTDLARRTGMDRGSINRYLKTDPMKVAMAVLKMKTRQEEAARRARENQE